MLGSSSTAFTDNQWRTVQLTYVKVWAIVLGVYIVGPLFMWLILQTWDSGALRTLNAIPTAVGTLAILIYGLRPTNLGWSSIIGGAVALLMDKDKTQGIATGPYWLWRIVVPFAFGYFFVGLTLSTWNFSEAPGAFWVVYLCTFGFVLWKMIWDVRGRWFMTISGIYMAVCIVGAIWTTFGDILHQESFDPDTFEPLEMGYINSAGEWVPDPRERTPDECRPAGTSHFTASGDVFPYATKGTCGSPVNGKRLIPIPSDHAPDLSRISIPSIVKGVLGLGEDEAAANQSPQPPQPTLYSMVIDERTLKRQVVRPFDQIEVKLQPVNNGNNAACYDWEIPIRGGENLLLSCRMRNPRIERLWFPEDAQRTLAQQGISTLEVEVRGVRLSQCSGITPPPCKVRY